MARSWLIDSKSIAKKVKNAAGSPAYQIKDCGANRECPKCHHRIDNSDVLQEWPGLPVGVKFDPSDAELLEHLAAKCGIGSSKPHVFIDEFIPTLEANQGICYAHPRDLPGAKKDGSSVHFFHRTINAYATGQRKRRKIHGQSSLNEEQVRWHKTGKTKAVIENGVQKGFKKIMVLYKSTKKGSRPDKSNWVMHQYHLGSEEDEKEGEYVVSKISYQQPKQAEKHDNGLINEEPDTMTLQTGPKTPKTNPPNPPRSGKLLLYDDAADDDPAPWPSVQEAEHKSPAVRLEDDTELPWLAGESQAVENSDLNCLGDSLLCNESFNDSVFLKNSGLNHTSYSSFAHNTFDATGSNNAPCGISDLENLDFDTPPDFALSDLQFGSQDSVLGWLDRL